MSGRLDVPRETAERLSVFVALLLRWNRRINLIGACSDADIWRRHVEDSLQLGPLMGSARSAIDLGSGAGFPGLVLAIATGVPFSLVEADRRKAAFLTEAARRTAAPVSVHANRIEGVQLAPAEVITARALAPLPRLLALAAPLLAADGACLFPKGRTGETELTGAATEWHMKVERFPSRTAATATIFRITEIARAGAAVKRHPPPG